ncbi:phage tail assembly protein [Marinobacterium litorale]|jgi:hypothetical protein|uniref:phage tail assembly protein n=1 Tax=Marinobacterium litorale TaxID=404770 RepID=UPI00040E623A|nr:phage tail assembly protein [Marinobacterium litorale]
MSSIEVELQHPISVDGAQVKILRLRRPKVRDMLGVEQGARNDAEKEIQLFANLCEVTSEQLLDLDMADYAKLQKAYQDFLS